MAVVEQKRKPASQTPQETVEAIFRAIVTTQFAGLPAVPLQVQPIVGEKCADCSEREGRHGHIDHCGGCECCGDLADEKEKSGSAKS